jgi:DNA polymerase-3 subunit epsilon
MEFAIVDIETTGGYAAGSGITEIAILIHDGAQVIDRYETLIDPQRSIPLSIQILTGIDNDMVAGSPVFRDVAERIYNMLAGRVFVAHSVNFDYTFVKHFLDASGFTFTASKLCTVRLSRKIKPGLPSYSLGKLCDSLGIALNNRHRAGGDAEATAELFTRLLAWDTEEHVAAMLKIKKEQALPPNVSREDYDRLPECPGVYYFSNNVGKVIYVGKAVNIRKRVSSHFTGHNPNPQRQHFLRNIHAIRYESCGTELMALLLEAVEIKRLWPEYNRAMKRFEPKFGLYAYEDLNGYLRLVVGKHNKNQSAVHVFNSQIDGRNLLYKLVRDFGLCTELSMLGPCSAECFANRDNDEMQHGNCVDLKTNEAYNALVKQALDHLNNNLPSFAIVDKGRHEEEKSCIWVEKGRFHAMGYIDRYTDVNNEEDIRSSLTRYEGNDYMLHLIQNYAGKYPYKVYKPSGTAYAADFTDEVYVED